MPTQLPSRFDSASLAWADLAATVRSHPLLAAIAVAVCTADVLVSAYLNLEDDISTRTLVRGLSLEVMKAFLITPVLLAAHRFVILGETTQNYVAALSMRRFWRFFVLSAIIVGLPFVLVLSTRSRSVADDLYTPALYVAVAGYLVVSLWLSLLFPAIAVDAPGTSVRNAVTDLAGSVWNIFWVGVIALLPLWIATLVVGGIQAMIFEDLNALSLRVAFAPLEGAMVAATYVLLVLIASRFYLAVGDRLTRPNEAAA